MRLYKEIYIENVETCWNNRVSKTTRNSKNVLVRSISSQIGVMNG